MSEVLFELSDGDLTKVTILEKRKADEVFGYNYMKRVQGLNKMYELIAYKKHLDKLKV